MFSKLALVFTLCIFVVICSLGLGCAQSPQTSSLKIEKVAEPLQHCEGPHWDVTSQKLYYVDISGQKILRLDPVTGKRTYAYFKDGPVGVVVPVEGAKDKLIAGVGKDVVLVTWDGENDTDNPTIEKLTSLDTDRNDTRVNDGKCDTAGRFWIGTMALEVDGKAEPNRGSLYLMDKNAKADKIISPVTISNGLTWNVQDDTMYYIDSPTLQIVAYDYNSASGSITNKRVVFDLKTNNITGVPDGMTSDANGDLWIAVYGGSAVLNVEAKTGKLIRKIEMPANDITSVTFGDPQLDTLYVTTFNDGKTSDAGAVFSVKGLGVKGRPGNNFKYTGN